MAGACTAAFALRTQGSWRRLLQVDVFAAEAGSMDWDHLDALSPRATEWNLGHAKVTHAAPHTTCRLCLHRLVFTATGLHRHCTSHSYTKRLHSRSADKHSNKPLSHK